MGNLFGQPGRPKKKRNKETEEQVRNESHLKRAKFGIRCSRFHKDGHKKATWKLPTTSTQPTPTATAIGHSPIVVAATEPSPTAAIQPTPTVVATQPTPTTATQPTPIAALSHPSLSSTSSQPSLPATSSQPTPTGGST